MGSSVGGYSVTDLRVAVVDIGNPRTNLGWAIDGMTAAEGKGLDECVAELASALRSGPLALGFEAPMFVPYRSNPKLLTQARSGDCVKGKPNRPFSAAAGAAVLVTALTVVPYVLRELRSAVRDATATLCWHPMPDKLGELLLFEAFVTDQRKTGAARHVEDARAAIDAFRRGLASTNGLQSAVIEDPRFNLLGAMMLRTAWASDPAILSSPCLVVRA
jgi:hypothetical protein